MNGARNDEMVVAGITPARQRLMRRGEEGPRSEAAASSAPLRRDPAALIAGRRRMRHRKGKKKASVAMVDRTQLQRIAQDHAGEHLALAIGGEGLKE